MFDFRHSIYICMGQFKGWAKSPRVYMAFLLGAALTVAPIQNYMNYAASLLAPVNIFEPFIILGSLREHMALLLLGLLLLLSDAPFVNQRTIYSMVRVSRKSWAVGMLLYIIVSATLYYLFILFFSMCYAAPHAYMGNYWSDSLYTLSHLHATISHAEYGIYFPYPIVLQALNPVQSLMHTILLSVGYGTILAVIMFVLNLYKGRIVGTVAALGTHAIGYILISEALISIPKISLLANAILGYHAFFANGSSEMTLKYSYSIFIGVMLLLSLIALIAIKKADYRISVGDKE